MLHSVTGKKQKPVFNALLVETDVPLADKNTFGTGGPARFFCQPSTPDLFIKALEFAESNELPIFVLGGGANILVSDQGFDGLVIRPALKQITVTKNGSNQVLVQAGAGLWLDDLITYCLDHNISGLEEFSGIPGNVGGAVYINLHYYEFLLEHFLVSGTIINKKTKEISTVDKTWFQFGYDQSKLQEQDFYILDATFRLKKVDDLSIAHARGRYQEIIRHRRNRYPYKNTCGSFFRNFHPHEVAHTDKKLPFVAYYLDSLGMKGQLSVGGAVVSHQHANMIVNQNNGTSADIVKLAQTMQTMVYEKYHIKPIPECQLIGFEKNPLE